MTERTVIVSVHPFRRTARKEERRLQQALTLLSRQERVDGYGPALPEWAKGVRVEKAGLLQWAVIATSHRGH